MFRRNNISVENKIYTTNTAKMFRRNKISVENKNNTRKNTQQKHHQNCSVGTIYR